ncbi:WXG100 family type VII secretion target [Streptomyces sp. NPDC006992]|uniref:WXG100 family type VII secretion target n=1 Tax=unclassified Streptomyces TaxID=2593676 RepID=UPI0033D36B22
MTDLAVTDDELAQLISDLDAMERYLKRKIERMDGLLDLVGNNWRGTTALAFKDLQRGVTDDARTVRESLILIEEAVKMSRDGFTAQELETLQKFRSLQASIEGSERLLDMADANPEGGAPKSRLSEL